ncbi:hypothetical protein ACXITQ_01060 [Lactobacillus delbrueckii]
MAKIKGANAVLDVMYKWGIDHLYGFPGGSFDSTMKLRNFVQFSKYQLASSDATFYILLAC